MGHDPNLVAATAATAESDRRTGGTMPAVRRGPLFVVTVVLASMVPAAPAVAHTGLPLGRWWSGIEHPVSGVDHLFAMVTVGILATVLRRPWQLPAAFLGSMCVGGILGIGGLSLPGGELAVALSVVVLGGALLVGPTLGAGPALGLVAAAGLVHGHAHGVEVPAATHPLVYGAGFLVATAVLHLAGVGVGYSVRHRSAPRHALGVAVLGVGLGLVAGLAA
ncbi:MAG: HupE/UreJ family protein [Acidimicrobiia bacterium]